MVLRRGYDEYGPPLHHPVYRLLYQYLRLRIELGCRLIQYEYRGSLNTALAMASRCFSPPESRKPLFSYHGVVAVRHLHYELMALAIFAALITSSMLNLPVPYAIFALTVSLKRSSPAFTIPIGP